MNYLYYFITVIIISKMIIIIFSSLQVLILYSTNINYILYFELVTFIVLILQLTSIMSSLIISYKPEKNLLQLSSSPEDIHCWITKLCFAIEQGTHPV